LDEDLPAQEEEDQCAQDDEAERKPSTPAVPGGTTTIGLSEGVVTSVHGEEY